MNEKIFYPVVALFTVLLIALSLVWPQGQGSVSPKPFGHAIEWPDYYRMVKDRDARHKRQLAEKAQHDKEAAASRAAQKVAPLRTAVKP